MAKDRRACPEALLLHEGLGRTAAMLLGAILLLASVAACTTGDVFSLEPAVDVGSQTAGSPAWLRRRNRWSPRLRTACRPWFPPTPI